MHTVASFGMPAHTFVFAGMQVFTPRSSGREIGFASLFDGGRGNIFTDIERAWTVRLSTLDFFDIAAPLFGRKFVVLFTARLPHRFCALTERLCLSSSPQAC